MADHNGGGLTFSPFSIITGGIAATANTVYRHFTSTPDLVLVLETPTAPVQVEPSAWEHYIASSSKKIVAGAILGVLVSELSTITGVCLFGGLMYWAGHRRRPPRPMIADPTIESEQRFRGLEAGLQRLQGQVQERDEEARRLNGTLLDLQKDNEIKDQQLLRQTNTVNALSTEKQCANDSLQSSKSENAALSTELKEERTNGKELRTRYDYLQSQLDSDSKINEGLSSQVDHYVETITGLRKRLQDYEPKISTMISEREKSEDALRCQVDEMKSSISDLEGLVEQLQPAKFKFLTDENCSIKSQLKITEEEKEGLQDRIDELRSSIHHDSSDSKQKISPLQEELDILRTTTEESKATNEALLKQIEDQVDSQSEAESAKFDQDSLQAELEHLRIEIRGSHAKNQALQNKLDKKENVDNISESFLTKCRELEDKSLSLQAANDQATISNGRLEETLRSLETKHQQLEESSRSLQAKFDLADADKMNLQAKLAQKQNGDVELQNLRTQYQQLGEASQTHQRKYDQADADNKDLSKKLSQVQSIQDDLESLRRQNTELDSKATSLKLTNDLADKIREGLQEQVRIKDVEIRDLKTTATRQLDSKDTEIQRLQETVDAQEMELFMAGVGDNMDTSNDLVGNGDSPPATIQDGHKTTASATRNSGDQFNNPFADGNNFPTFVSSGEGLVTFNKYGNEVPLPGGHDYIPVQSDPANGGPQPGPSTFSFGEAAKGIQGQGGFNFSATSPQFAGLPGLNPATTQQGIFDPFTNTYAPIAAALSNAFPQNAGFAGGSANVSAPNGQDDDLYDPTKPKEFNFSNSTTPAGFSQQISAAPNGLGNNHQDPTKPLSFNFADTANLAGLAQRTTFVSTGQGNNQYDPTRPTDFKFTNSDAPRGPPQQHPPASNSNTSDLEATLSRLRALSKEDSKPDAPHASSTAESSGNAQDGLEAPQMPDSPGSASPAMDAQTNGHTRPTKKPRPGPPSPSGRNIATPKSRYKLKSSGTGVSSSSNDNIAASKGEKPFNFDEYIDSGLFDEGPDSNPPTPEIGSPVDDKDEEGSGVDWDDVVSRPNATASPTTSDLFEHLFPTSDDNGSGGPVTPGSPSFSDGGGDAAVPNPEEVFTKDTTDGLKEGDDSENSEEE